MEIVDAREAEGIDEKGSDSSEEYDVESILESRFVWIHQKQFRVKWVNYHDEWNSWEPMENLRGCADLVAEFEKKEEAEKLKKEESERAEALERRKQAKAEQREREAEKENDPGSSSKKIDFNNCSFDDLFNDPIVPNSTSPSAKKKKPSSTKNGLIGWTKSRNENTSKTPRESESPVPLARMRGLRNETQHFRLRRNGKNPTIVSKGKVHQNLAKKNLNKTF